MRNPLNEIRLLKQAHKQDKLGKDGLRLIDSLVMMAQRLGAKNFPSGVVLGIILTQNYPVWAQRLLDTAANTQKAMGHKTSEALYCIAIKAVIDHLENKDIAQGLRELREDS